MLFSLFGSAEPTSSKDTPSPTTIAALIEGFSQNQRQHQKFAAVCLVCALAMAGLTLFLTLRPHELHPTHLMHATTACLIAAAAFTIFGGAAALRAQSLQPVLDEYETYMQRIDQEIERLNLSAKETTVVKLILQHFSYEEIARKLNVTTRTVQMHASRAFRKAYVSNRRDFERVMLNERLDLGSVKDREAAVKQALHEAEETRAQQAFQAAEEARVRQAQQEAEAARAKEVAQQALKEAEAARAKTALREAEAVRARQALREAEVARARAVLQEMGDTRAVLL